MGNSKKPTDKSRRGFFSLLLAQKEKEADSTKIKMLTADGKLVEIDKAVLDQASKKQKASNKEIFDWMNNPSKEKS